MPVVQIPTPVSIQKQVQYNANQRVNSKTIGPKPGLEDEIRELPWSLMRALRESYGKSTGQNLYFGLSSTWNSSAISANQGYAVIDTPELAVYFLETLTLTPTAAAYWGFFEIELVAAADSDSTGLDFWDNLTNIPFVAAAPTKKKYVINVYENYNTTAVFPSVTPGRIKWIDYKKDEPFGNIIESNNYLSSGIVNAAGKDVGDLTITRFKKAAIASSNPYLDLSQPAAVLDVVNYPLYVPLLRTKLLDVNGTSAFPVFQFTSTGISVDLYFTVNATDQQIFDDLAEDLAWWIAKGGIIGNWFHVITIPVDLISGLETVPAGDYYIQALDAIGLKITIAYAGVTAGGPYATSGNGEFYPHRVVGNIGQARHHQMDEISIFNVRASGSIGRTAGLRRRYRIVKHGHPHRHTYSTLTGAPVTLAGGFDYSVSGTYAGLLTSISTSDTADPANSGSGAGTPILGNKNEPDSATFFFYEYVGVYN